jgi:hypothetical protein
MAINYTNFATAIGAVIKKVDTYNTWIATLASERDEVIAMCSAEGQLQLVDDVPDAYGNFQDVVSGWITSGLKGYTDKLLTNPGLVTSNLPVGDVNGVSEVLVALRKDMVTNSETVLKCTVTVGSITYTLANTLAVKLITTTTLDGVNPPASYAAAMPAYAGVTSELAQDSQTVTLTCTADSESGGTLRGAETFSIVGNPASGSYRKTAEGIGEDVITVGNVASGDIIAGGDFDSWTAGNPDGWTVNDGVAAADFVEESGNGLRGTSALKLLGGATNVDLSQIIPEANFVRRQAYALVAMVKKAGTTGTAVISLKDGATTIASLNIDISTAAAGWNLHSNVFVVPAAITADYVLRIVADTSGFNGNPLIDDILLVPMKYVGGIGMALVALDTKVMLGDKAAFALSNDNDGVFQTYFRRQYGVQLPSADVSGATIDEALAIE